MEPLFGPWRMQFILEHRDAANPCVLCEVPRAPSDREGLIVCRGEACYVLLNLYPYNSGHLMVVPYRHVDTLGALDAAERRELLELLARGEAVLAQEYGAQGFNVGANLGAVAGAGIPGHVHFHLLPRWQGDTNFLPIFGRTKSIPESLQDTYDRLKGAWK
ncbi:MAG: HIT domain-containing protein [Planctomycetes bacterium]|nr:HIT domain-containing protein [Planctomycetota bacterium]